MKTLFLATALSATALSFTLVAQAAEPEGCVQVDVHNVRPQQGQLMVAAYGDAESFGKKPLAQMRVPAGDAVTSFQLCGLVGDLVALTVFQDLDSDGKMNKNLLGMPTEPWGASGTPGVFGPSWETGRVPLDGKPIVVRLTQ
jgi:uncharacterized protein (DUF2141 family)